MAAEPESLESIAYLVEATTRPSSARHLVSLVHQRCSALLLLQLAVRDLVWAREPLVSLASTYRDGVEAAIGGAEDTGRGAARKALQKTQDAFLSAYEQEIVKFETEWDVGSQAFDRWELDPAPLPSPASQAQDPVDYPDYPVPDSWLTNLDYDVETAVYEFLRLIIADPYTLGAGIATLEGPSLASLLLQQPSPRHPLHSPSPLEILLNLLAASVGPEAVLALALGAFETGTRELVGREASRKGATTGAREKEVEGFLVALLDVVDSLGLEVSWSASSPGSGASAGPLVLHRGTEDVLLHLLHEARTLRPPSQTPTFGPHSPSSSPTFPSSWGSTVTSTWSTLNAGLYNVASIGSTVASVGLGFLPMPPTAPTPSHQLPPSATPPSPSLPSKINGPVPHPWTPLTHLLTQTATSLLRLLTPSPPSQRHPAPLIERLLSHLLRISFPLPSGDGAGHRKVLLLGLIRWYGFGWLGKNIGRAAVGGAYTTSAIPRGVRLARDAEEEAPLPGSRGRAGTALLDEVYVSGRDSVDLLLGLHKVLYGVLVAACGFGAEEWDAKVGEGEREKRELKAAAKAVVHAWGGGTGKLPTFESTEASGGVELAAFALSPTQFLKLRSSFSELLLRSPAAGPKMSPAATSFKRSSAFGTSSPSPTSPTSPRSRTPTDNSTLGERLEVAAGQIAMSTTDAPALLFTSPSTTGKVIVTSRPPAPLRPPNRPSLRLDPLRGTAHPLNPSHVDRTGWTSPPRSPRHEAIQSSIQSGSYFSHRTPSPSSSPPDAALSWHPPKDTNPSLPAFSPTPTPAEISLVRKGIFSLIRAGFVRPRPCHPSASDVFRSPSPASVEGKAVLDTLEFAVQRSAVEHDWLAHSSYSQALAVVKRCHAPDFLLTRIAAPLRELERSSQSVLRLAQRRLDDLETQRRVLRDIAREERGLLEDLRVRAFYSSLKGSNLGEQVRSRLADISWSRSPEEVAEAVQKVHVWARELGVFSFLGTRGESSFEESLMLLELATTLATEPTSFYSSEFWAREATVMADLVGRSRPKSAPSFAETLFASGSSILTAPLSLAGLPYSSAPQPPPGPMPKMAFVVLSFGACSSALLRPNEGTVASVRSLEDHLLRVSLKVAAYLVSDYFASTIANRDADGHPVGCDSWIEEFASPLSPLLRPSQGEACGPLPRAYQVTTPPVAQHFYDLLNRFTFHPSPHGKVLALFELELVLASAVSATSSPDAIPPPPDSRTTSPGRGAFTKLSDLLSRRMSFQTSPIAMLLEEEEGDGIGHRHGRAASSLSDPDVFATPRRRRQMSAASGSGNEAEMLRGGREAAGRSAGQLANTDDLLIAIEDVLRHVRPSLLFQNLQIVASLVPSVVLDGTPAGKAFWDCALAALSIKRDLVEGEFGVVERGLTALSEGTSEGRELAERLIQIGAREESTVALELGLSL